MRNVANRDLSHNRIAKIPAPTETESLNVLFVPKNCKQKPNKILSLFELPNRDLSDNRIEVVPDNLTLLDGLMELTMSHNRIKTLPNLTKLSRLVKLFVCLSQSQLF